ncbi:MAG TPA: RNA-directed DNA polymerase [bacterium]|nr:RNA-directed DNA polymerase [bacterium]HPT29522.1 RNA-directed DNA polymerase [bacterium]
MSDKLLVDLFQAYYDARRYKRNTMSALNFEINLEQNIFELYREIKNNTYQISPSLAFIIFDPVQREIIASPFRDRVVHHLVFNYINPILENLFISDSYSCRQGKGISYGVKRVAHFVRSSSQNYRVDNYILKLDISGYFMSINQSVLYDKVENYLLRHNVDYPFDLKLISALLKRIVFHDYIKDCVIRGGKTNWKKLPRNKSLFFTPPGFGLPIGNLTSQLFSNVYLNDFDHYIKRTLKFKYYGRYVDDLIIIDGSKERLQIAMAKIAEYLSTNLNLKIHPRKIYLQPYAKGVNFLGGIIKPHRIYVRHRTKTSFYRSATKANNILKNVDVERKALRKILSSFNSYLGVFGQYQTYNLRRKILDNKLSSDFWRYFRLGKGESRYRKIVLRK